MIELRSVSLSYGEKSVLSDFSLTLPETGILCLSGPSGCGKTTLTRVLAFLETPDTGEVAGLAPGETAVLFQEDRLLPWLSAADNLKAACPGADALAWLSAVGLADEANTKPAALSGGMRRRAALARALAYESRLLILDEPFNGVDEAAKRSLYPLIRQAAADKPVLLITHHQPEIDALADRIVRLDGPPLRILSDQ